LRGGVFEQWFILFLQLKQKKIIETVTKENINMIVKYLFNNSDLNLWDDKNEPEMNLFYWCVLSNRREIAHIFWCLGKVNQLF
jgi:hypothetical protein